MDERLDLGILLIEDNADHAKLIQRQIDPAEGHSITLEWFDRLSSGLARLEKQDIDAVLLGLNLPDSRGIESITELKDRHPTVPIIVLTSLNDQEMGLQAVQQGAQDFLVKGNITSDSLERAIRYGIERHQLYRRLEASEERYALVASAANDGLWDWNLRTNEIFFSPRWKAILGHDEDGISSSPDEWFGRVHAGDIDRLDARIRLHTEGGAKHLDDEHRLLHKDGSYRWVRCHGLAVFDRSGKAHRLVGSSADITRRKNAEENLFHDANHDALTGLPNRNCFLDRLRRVIDMSANRAERMYAVLYMDLDGFKHVNDSLGHRIGDELLVTMSRRVVKCVRPGDIVSRLGGDEFCILIDDISNNSDAVRVANRIHASLEAPFSLSGHDVVVGASIGIAHSATGYEAADDILRDADIAMYRAKALGKNRYVLFDAEMHDRAVARLRFESDLRLALADGRQLEVHYQPIVSMENGRITGLEALVRWRHPERGLMPPDQFIPIAEETGLIIPLGKWVLEESCRQMCEWKRDASTSTFPSLSVNLSCKQLSEEFVQLVGETLADTDEGAGALALNLEITESLILESARTTERLLQRLRQLGIHLCLDDFGTGYSSLSYLRNSPIEILKIDKSFVADMMPDGENTAIVRSVIALGENLGLMTIAEGVETKRQFDQLEHLGCGYAQGYLMSRPLVPEEVPELLSKAPFWFDERRLDVSRCVDL